MQLPAGTTKKDIVIDLKPEYVSVALMQGLDSIIPKMVSQRELQPYSMD